MGDFFNRKSLLPAGQRARLTSNRTGPPSSASEPPSLEFEPRRARLSEPEVFERPTVVPALSPEEHARRLMRSIETRESEAALAPTAVPPPETKPSPPALPSSTVSAAAPKSASEAATMPRNEMPLSFAALDLDLDVEASALDLVELQAGRERSSLPSEPPSGRVMGAEPLPEFHDRPTRELSMSDLYQLGDFSGALEAAESKLAHSPKDAEALRFQSRCQEVLTTMWTARLGAPDRPVRMLIAEDQLRWLSVDHRAGFVISLIDGHATLEQILDIAGMPRIDALRILAELSERGVIEVAR